MTQCDEIGLEEYIELRKAHDKLLELYKSCPCDEEPRPETITDEHLSPTYSRDKRNVKNDSLLGTKDADGRVYGCENTNDVGFDDVILHLEDVVELIEDQRKCCDNKTMKEHKRLKRQLMKDKRNMTLLWEMPIYYDYVIGAPDEWLNNISLGLATIE
uniref:Uncharacterized protein n=1 Tax=Meloidogyne hapla TaxID=6305 RepID=A0A1I8BU56_MELHA